MRLQSTLSISEAWLSPCLNTPHELFPSQNATWHILKILIFLTSSGWCSSLDSVMWRCGKCFHMQHSTPPAVMLGVVTVWEPDEVSETTLCRLVVGHPVKSPFIYSAHSSVHTVLSALSVAPASLYLCPWLSASGKYNISVWHSNFTERWFYTNSPIALHSLALCVFLPHDI